jgi:hypothetical protein
MRGPAHDAEAFPNSAKLVRVSCLECVSGGCLVQQFGRHAEVDLRASEIRMSQVCRQVGKKVTRWDVAFPAAPADGRGAKEIIEKRWITSCRSVLYSVYGSQRGGEERDGGRR